MKIFLNELELEAAISVYVKSLGITLPNAIEIELKAGRGSNGHTASVAFGEGELGGSHGHTEDTQENLVTEIIEPADPNSSLFQDSQDA